MRNLKRVLSLALALVMVLGMMVITTSAADYADADEITNKEAVEVLSALGIVGGDGTNFNPNGTFTREAAAKLITYMLIGGDMAEKLAGTDVFTDVAATRWSAKYIGYCANLGYIGGVGNGKFNPTGVLKDIELGKLVLCALGNDPAKYTGANWASAVTVDMIEAGLVEAVTGTTISREDACAMILAGLKYSETPDTWNVIDTKGTDATTDDEIISNFDDVLDAVLYVKLLNGDEGTRYTYDEAPATDTLLNKVYKVNSNDTTAADDFGRPGIRYTDAATNGKKVNLFFADEAAYTYNVTGRQDTTLAQIAEKLDLTVAGATMEAAVKGDTVELYLNADGKVADAVKLHTELAKVAKITKATDEDAKYTYIVSVTTSAGVANYEDTALVGFDAETMTKGTYVTIIKGTDTAIVAVADSVTGKQTAKGQGYTKIDGVKYEYAGASWAIDAVNYADTFDFYLSDKGQIIGTVEAEAAKEDVNIFYVSDKKFTLGGTFQADTAKIAVINLDGTEEILDIAITVKNGTKYIKLNGSDVALATDYALANGFYAYTLNDEGEVASLQTCAKNGDEYPVEGYRQILSAGNSVVTAEDSAVVTIVGDQWYATTATTVTVADNGKATTVTGYANFEDKTYTPNTNNVDAILINFDKNNVLAIYVLGGELTVSDDAVIGYMVETGDEYVEKNTTYQDVVYSVAGEKVTYKVVKADSYPTLASIVVTDGVAALSNATATTNADVDKVTDTYFVTDAGVQYLAENVAIYDVTNVKKNGVMVTDGIAVNDIVTFTKNAKGEVNAIYITYAAQEEGVISLDLTDPAALAYYTDVLGMHASVAETIVDNNYGYAVFQYSLSAGWGEHKINLWDVEDPDNKTPLGVAALTPGRPYTCGTIVYGTEDADLEITYGYEVIVDDVVIQTGTFVLEK